MRPARPSTWFQLDRAEAGCGLRYNSDLPFRLVSGAGSLHDRSPALACFLGRGRKDRALRYMFADNHPRKASGFNLQADNRFLSSECPVLFADGDPHQEPRPLDAHSTTPTEQMPITWAPGAETQALDVLLARFLLPLSHVACIFAADVGGISGVRALLASWSLVGQDATEPPLRPRVLIVVESDACEAADLEGLLLEDGAFAAATLCPIEEPDLFASLHVVHVSPRCQVSDEARFFRLKDEIFKALDLACRDRREAGLQFSAAHLPGLLLQAVRHSARTREQPFDIIAAARPPPRLEEWVSHLGGFLERGRDLEPGTQDSIIASSLLIDAYPPHTHVFDPHILFHDRYRQVCLKALQVSESADTASRRCRSVESGFVDRHAEMVTQSKPPRVLHTRRLTDLANPLGNIHCDSTCLGCLLRAPQHALSCRHALCDTCVAEHGQLQAHSEHTYFLELCPLCQQSVLVSISLLPLTAAVRALTVDGGGIRVVVSVQILQGLQSLLGPDCPLPDLIDVAFGTSAGGDFILDVFVMGRTIAQSAEAFPKLLFRFFGGQRRRPVLTWPCRMVRCLLGRGLYDAAQAESFFREYYGNSRRLFGPCRSKAKVAVTTTTNSAVILTNYRPATRRPDDLGYQGLSVPTPDAEPFVWQCARATSAAPLYEPTGYFRPFHLPRLGDCWDGGLAHNNPSLLCRQDLQYMWPWEPPLGILLSIGTGTSGSTGRPASTRRHFFWPLLDTLMKSMDGRASWLSFVNQTAPGKQDALYRLDVQLQGPEPALDAAEQMDNLIQQAIAQGVGEDGRRCLLRLLAQSLFFELASAPAPDQECSGGLFRCVGSLRCRIPGRTFLAAMHRLDPSRKQFLLNGQRLRRDVVAGSTCQSCGRYCVPIRFSVRRLQDVVSLSIRFANGQQFSIGGFPQTIRWFMKQQGFSAVYGFSGRSHGLEACRSCARRLSARNLRLAQVKARRSVHIVTAVPVSGRMAEI